MVARGQPRKDLGMLQDILPTPVSSVVLAGYEEFHGLLVHHAAVRAIHFTMGYAVTRAQEGAHHVRPALALLA